MNAVVEALVFDLGDVLFSWAALTDTSIHPQQLKSILDSPTWHQYECNAISRATCFERCAQQFDTSVDELSRAFDQARASLTANDQLVNLVKELRAANQQLRVYAMSNISMDDYNFLRNKEGDADWTIFDQVFTSAAAGTRKPNLSFFHFVLHKIGGDPTSMMFIDDRKENVVAARSCGMHGVVYDIRRTPVAILEKSLRNAVLNPLARGSEFLRIHSGHLVTQTEDGTELRENFAQLLILEVTDDKSLVSMTEPEKGHIWNYYQGTQSTTPFPCDLDTTSLALTTLPTSREDALSTIELMLKYVNEEGIVMTYFDANRLRTDPVVCVNVLSLFYTYGRESKLAATLDWVINVLKHRAYLQGTRYYCTAEAFLYFFHRLLQRAPALQKDLGPIVLQHTLERIGEPGDPMAHAMRILILVHYHEQASVDREVQALRALQDVDGGWPISYIYTYGSTGLRIGSRGLSTAFAVAALRAAQASSVDDLPRM